MANYYAIDIKSDKITAAVALVILNKVNEERLMREFFYDNGTLHIYVRGFPNGIAKLLEDLRIADDEIKVEDEFEIFWNSISEEERAQIELDAKKAEENLSKSEFKNQCEDYTWEN